jgi:hypothetical protein
MTVFRWLFGLVLCCILSACATAYEGAPTRAVSLDGRWSLNTTASDDVEKMLHDKLELERAKYRRDMERWRRARAGPGQPTLPPLGEDRGESSSATQAARDRVMRQRTRDEKQFRHMLGISPTLRIRHDGPRLEIVSTVESRRFEAGSHTQVSMPEGQVADSRVGWDGEWFVVERRVRDGPRVTEKFRLIRKTDQLEYLMAWSGETELEGLKVRRIYDRTVGEEPVVDPGAGPVR